MEKEIWKDIKEYKNLYKVSNLGRVKSLKRKIIRKDKVVISVSEKILSPRNNDGYLSVALCKNNKCKAFKIHILVGKEFLNYNPIHSTIVIDHKDNNKTNNDVNNLQIVSNRFNTSKRHNNKFGQGVTKKSKNSYRARIYHNKKQVYLGSYKTSELASKAYQNYLIKHNL